jgi:hypothetical protein
MDASPTLYVLVPMLDMRAVPKNKKEGSRFRTWIIVALYEAGILCVLVSWVFSISSLGILAALLVIGGSVVGYRQKEETGEVLPASVRNGALCGALFLVGAVLLIHWLA